MILDLTDAPAEAKKSLTGMFAKGLKINETTKA